MDVAGARDLENHGGVPSHAGHRGHSPCRINPEVGRVSSVTFRLRVRQFSYRQFRKAATAASIQYRCKLKVVCILYWDTSPESFLQSHVSGSPKESINLSNLSNSSDTSDTVAVAALCDSQLLISGKQLNVWLSLESHR